MFRLDGLKVIIDRARKRYERDGARALSRAIADDVAFRGYRNVLVPYLLNRYDSMIFEADDLRQYADQHGRFMTFDMERLPLDGRTVSGGIIEYQDDTPSDVQNTPMIPFYTCVNPFVCEIPDATVLGAPPIGVTADGHLILDTVTHTREQNNQFETVLARLFKRFGLRTVFNALRGRVQAMKHGEQFEHACLLDGLWTENYGHWMHEEVYKLRAVERYEEYTGERPTLLFRKSIPDWKRRHLELLGYNDEDYVRWTGVVTKVDRLVVPRHPQPTPDAIRWLRNRTLAASADEPLNIDLSPYIYISRGEADRRHVRNEDEVINALSEYGFCTYTLGELDIADQARLFAGADIIVGPAGSGFSNIAYATNPTLIELVGHKAGVDWFRVAKMMGWNHKHVFCERRWRDLVVDVEELEAIVADCLSAD